MKKMLTLLLALVMVLTMIAAANAEVPEWKPFEQNVTITDFRRVTLNQE